ncbi:hypothetical protein [Streptomyces sp. enrichment culture]|uniref:hypothetical protein n=1 Tax=Streptomyces sp. enrichment culture TaxID=1795815 RepID=UPI003F578156
MGIGARKRLAAMGGILAGAVVAAGIGLYATDSGPFHSTYCWGAWHEDSGAPFLDDEKLEESGSRREGSETAPPSAEHPRATCWVEMTSTWDGDASQEPMRFGDRITVDYGPVPGGGTERHKWLAQNLHGSAAPLPDGLDGVVGSDRAMLVLPEECDVSGRPSAVTIRAESRGDGPMGEKTLSSAIGPPTVVAGLLLDVANTAMGTVGCAPEEPLRSSSPFVTVAEDDDGVEDPLCRIPGVRLDVDRQSYYRQQVGAVTDRLQTCSVAWSLLGQESEPVAQYVMTSIPRLAALFDGLPEGRQNGLTRVTCDGRETVFYGRVHGAPAVEKVAVERSFENFVASVGHRIGCRTEGKA